MKKPLDKNKRNILKKVLIPSGVVLVASTMIWQLIAMKSHLDLLDQKWHKVSDGMTSYLSGLAKFHRNAGYGGYIHNFKNYVLRRDILLKDIIDNELEEIFHAIQSLNSVTLLLGDNTDVLLKRIRRTFINYREMTDVAFKKENLILSAKEMDKKVRVNDRLALDSLSTLSLKMEHYINNAYREVDNEIEELRKDIYWRILYLILFLLFTAIIYHHISSEERLLLKLKEIEKRFSLITDHIDSAFWIAEPGMKRMIYLSPAYERLTGLSCRKIYNDPQKYFSAIYKEDQLYVKQNYDDAVEKWEWSVEYRIQKDYGQMYWMREKVFSVLGRNGKTKMLVGIISDITDRKIRETEVELLRDKAEQSNKYKSEFLSNMSHEIRTPLNVISGITDLLGEELRGQDDYKQYLEMLSTAQKSLMALVNGILDLSKIESNKIELETSIFNLSMAVKDVVSFMDVKAKSEGVKLDLTLAGKGDVFIQSDIVRLKQVLINLVSNAIKFSNGNPVVTHVDCKVPQGKKGNFVFSVSDSGIGMSQAACNKIFDSFTQAESGTTRKYGGSGLGLTIAKGLVEILGGEIWVESTEGKGTTFYFTITAERVRDIAVTENPMIEPMETSLKEGLRVLLVDDSHHNRAIVKAFLKSSPLGLIDEADDGPVALEKMKENEYDIVLLDIQMPTLSGHEVIKEIRSYEKKQQQRPRKIVALSANAIKEEIEKCKQEGFDDYLTKPIKKEILLKYLSKIT